MTMKSLTYTLIFSPFPVPVMVYVFLLTFKIAACLEMSGSAFNTSHAKQTHIIMLLFKTLSRVSLLSLV